MTKSTKVRRAKGFGERFGSMLRVDAKRMFGSPMLYIMLLIAVAVPILMLVMTSMVGGDGAQGMAFTNTWDLIATDGNGMMEAMGSMMGGGGDAAAAGAGMDMTAMMNINMMYFLLGVFVCLFVAEDFRSGYAKNLFTVRARKSDYVASKTVMGFLAGALFLAAFFIGTVVGGKIGGVPFALGESGIFGLVMCMVAKTFLMALFSGIFVLMSVVGKHRAWMSILLSLFVGMLLFMMIPMMTPITSGVMNVGMCAAGGVLFSIGFGAVSNTVLKTTSLVG